MSCLPSWQPRLSLAAAAIGIMLLVIPCSQAFAQGTFGVFVRLGDGPTGTFASVADGLEAAIMSSDWTLPAVARNEVNGPIYGPFGPIPGSNVGTSMNENSILMSFSFTTPGSVF